jgi:hypothetical protein
MKLLELRAANTTVPVPLDVLPAESVTCVPEIESTVALPAIPVPLAAMP